MKNKAIFKKNIFIFLIFILLFTVSGCQTLKFPFFTKKDYSVEKTKIELSRKILGKGQLTPKELAEFFLSQNPDVDYTRIFTIARHYYLEAYQENINSTVAFAQMCLETGFLRFGNLVTPEMNNFCGLGSMDAEHKGESFPTIKLGVRAHIQHLQAYATTEDVELNKELVDPRYSWVHKAKFAETIFDLAGNWATDKNYGTKIDAILTQMQDYFFEKNRIEPIYPNR